MKQEPFGDFSAPTRLAMHKDSHVVSKLKPEIRIIHLFAPEIIKTDVENFRELVQKLTGKPSGQKESVKKIKQVQPIRLKASSSELSKIIKSTNQLDGNHFLHKGSEMTKKPSKELYAADNSSGFLDGFADANGLIQDLSEFPLQPFKSPQRNLFGERSFF